jgi:hypothetical protein
MNDRKAERPNLERAFFSRPSWIPSTPINPKGIDVFLERYTYRLMAVAAILAIAAYYAPEALAYKSHFNDPGVNSATRVNWTLFVVVLYVVSTVMIYWFATFRAKRDRLLTICLIKDFPNEETSIHEGMDQHHGLIRLAILSALVSGSIIGGAAYVQDSSLWWKAPQLHIPLVFIHLCGVFFLAGYFLLRTLAVNRIMRMALEKDQPPSVPLRKYDQSDLYSQLGYHYLLVSSFALFSATYLFLVWMGLQFEAGGITPSFGFSSAITWTVGPGYFLLVFALVFKPIWIQRGLLQEWNKKRLDSLAEKIDKIVETKNVGSPAELERLATYKVAYDALESSFPAWPLHPNQARVVVAIPTTVFFPIVGLVLRSGITEFFG